MPLSEEQYERIARRLDGEDAPLTDAERAAAEEIRLAEAALAPRLTVQAGPAMQRARRRLAAELARPRVRVWRVAVAAGAAVAAALLIAVLLHQPRPQGPGTVATSGVTIDEKYLKALDEAYAEPALPEVVNNVAIPTWSKAIELEIKALDGDLDVFYLHDVIAYPGEG